MNYEFANAFDSLFLGIYDQEFEYYEPDESDNMSREEVALINRAMIRGRILERHIEEIQETLDRLTTVGSRNTELRECILRNLRALVRYALKDLKDDGKNHSSEPWYQFENYKSQRDKLKVKLKSLINE